VHEVDSKQQQLDQSQLCLLVPVLRQKSLQGLIESEHLDYFEEAQQFYNFVHPWKSGQARELIEVRILIRRALLLADQQLNGKGRDDVDQEPAREVVYRDHLEAQLHPLRCLDLISCEEVDDNIEEKDEVD
jgi:hypothetical protein